MFEILPSILFLLLGSLVLILRYRRNKMKSHIKIFCGGRGAKLINGFPLEEEEDRLMIVLLFINPWLVVHKKSCFIYYESEIPIAFMLLSDVNHDPFNREPQPIFLNFIYVRPEYRRMGYASKLLVFARRSNIRLTSFCLTNASEKLFKKHMYLNKGYLNGVTICVSHDDS